MFLTLKIKLIIAAVIVAILGAGGFYVWNLHNQVDDLKAAKIELTQQVEQAQATIEETSRREQVVDDVSTMFDVRRAENQRTYEKKVERINESVKEGKDRPVGPLLNDYFNDGLQRDEDILQAPTD